MIDSVGRDRDTQSCRLRCRAETRPVYLIPRDAEPKLTLNNCAATTVITNKRSGRMQCIATLNCQPVRKYCLFLGNSRRLRYVRVISGIPSLHHCKTSSLVSVKKSYGHLRLTMADPHSSYSSFVIHISWKVPRLPSMLPPSQDRIARSGSPGESILTRHPGVCC